MKNDPILAIARQRLFRGYDSFAEKDRSPAVRGTPGTLQQGTEHFRSAVCTSLTEIYSSLSLSGEVSASYGGASGEAKAEYVSSLNLTSTSVVVVVYVANVMGRISAVDATLSVPPYGPEALLTFFRRHGDAWVDSVTLASEYWATYVFDSKITEVQSSLVASLTASAEWGVGKVSATIGTAVANAEKQTLVSATFDQHMLGIDGVAYPEADRIIPFALAFPTLQSSTPVVELTVQGYERVEGVDYDTFAPLRQSRERFGGDGGPGDSLRARLAQLALLETRTDAVQALYDVYGYTGDSKLAGVRGQLVADRDALTAAADRVREDPLAAWQVPSTPSLGHGFPEARYAFNNQYIYGGTSDAAWSMGDRDRVGMRITSVEMTWGEIIDRIAVEYENAAGESFPTGGHGGGPSPNQATLLLQPGEYIDHLEIWDTGGGEIRKVVARTPTQTMVWGNEGGNRSQWDFSPDDFILLSFQGRKHDRLCALGPILLRFQPAAWKPAA